MDIQYQYQLNQDLVYKAHTGTLEEVRELIAQGADVNYVSSNYDGYSVLMVAV